MPLPGACAAVCALSGAGLPSRRFAFEGFLPDKKGERERYLAGLRGDTHTLVFYIAPHDAQRDLARPVSGARRPAAPPSAAS